MQRKTECAKEEMELRFSDFW